MKSILLHTLLFAFFVPSAFAQVSENAEEAFRWAQQGHKPVLLIFSGSDWCAPCVRFEKRILSDSIFQKFSDHQLILLKADFPQRKKLPQWQQIQNDKLAEQFNPKGIFPYLVLLKEDGGVLTEVNYRDQSPHDFIAELFAYLAKIKNGKT